MLTKKDIQIVKEIVTEVVNEALKNEITPFRTEFNALKSEFNALRTEFNTLKEENRMFKLEFIALREDNKRFKIEILEALNEIKFEMQYTKQYRTMVEDHEIRIQNLEDSDLKKET
jgi:hypothetical protein